MKTRVVRLRSVLYLGFALMAVALRPVHTADGGLVRALTARLARAPLGREARPSEASQPGWVNYTDTNKVLDLVFDANGYLWAATTGGVVRWDVARGTYRRYTTADGLADHFVASVAVAPNGALWFGTVDSLSRYADRDGSGEGEWTTYRAVGGVDCTCGAALAFSPDGVLWIATAASKR